jgi:heme/copper-type cytochrome/quinol oxidase subunit 4
MGKHEATDKPDPDDEKFPITTAEMALLFAAIVIIVIVVIGIISVIHGANHGQA